MKAKSRGHWKRHAIRFIFYCGSSIMNEIERVAVQGSGLVNILAYGHLIFHGR